MTIVFWISSAGLLFDMLGAMMMYFNTPKVETVPMTYMRSEMEAILAADRRRNRMIRLGVALLAFGFLLQWVGLYLSTTNTTITCN